jgi:hypothetical protein
MLRIQKNSTTSLIVTVTELTTVTPVYYLFEFEHQQSFEKEYCILTNISTNKERYDEFSIVDGVDVTFPFDGYYIYRIYQQTSSVNLDPELSDGLVEEGRAHVFETDSPSNEYNEQIIVNIYE